MLTYQHIATLADRIDAPAAAGAMHLPEVAEVLGVDQPTADRLWMAYERATPEQVRRAVRRYLSPTRAEYVLSALNILKGVRQHDYVVAAYNWHRDRISPAG